MDKNKIASELVKVAKLLQGMEFPSQEALKKYMKEHPNATPSKHSVKKTDKTRYKGDSHNVGIRLRNMDDNEKKTYVKNMVNKEGHGSAGAILNNALKSAKPEEKKHLEDAIKHHESLSQSSMEKAVGKKFTKKYLELMKQREQEGK